MAKNEGKRVSARQLATRTIKELEEEIAYFEESTLFLLKEIESLKCQVQAFETIGTVEDFRTLQKQNNAKNNIALDNVFCQWEYIDSHSYRAMIPCTQKIRNIQAMRYYKFCPFCGKKIKVVENE